VIQQIKLDIALRTAWQNGVLTVDLSNAITVADSREKLNQRNNELQQGNGWYGTCS
jgi:hypothetical protein